MCPSIKSTYLFKEIKMPKTLMCDPKLLEKDLSGRTYMVTGANSGSGFATAEQLAKQGALVIAACRRVDAGNAAFADTAKLRGSVEIMELDLASLESVRKFAEAFKAKYDRLDGLINNAGIMAVPEGKTVDGFETQFGVNHLGHFLLTELLLETLKASAPARIVNVSSAAHAGMMGSTAEINFDDLNYEKRKYDAAAAYNQSKLANLLHAKELAKQLEGTGVSAFSVHPGWIRSNLVEGAFAKFVQNVLLRPFSGMLGTMDWFEGAQTTLHCLLDDDAPKNSGAFYSQTSILYQNKADKVGAWPMKSPNPIAHDDAVAEKLYTVSKELVGLS